MIVAFLKYISIDLRSLFYKRIQVRLRLTIKYSLSFSFSLSDGCNSLSIHCILQTYVVYRSLRPANSLCSVCGVFLYEKVIGALHTYLSLLHTHMYCTCTIHVRYYVIMYAELLRHNSDKTKLFLCCV